MKEQRDARGRLTIDLSDEGSTFEVYASRLEAHCGARQVRRLDSPDQRYWDYDIENTTVVLHFDEFAGITLHVENGSCDSLLRRIAKNIGKPLPKRNVK